MEKFTTLTGIAAPLPLINIDTDMLVPKQYLKTILRTGLGKILFSEMRFQSDGTEIAGFVLNKAPWRQAKIIDQLMADAQSENPSLTIDLEAQTITRPNGETISFSVEGSSRRALLDGLDEIGLSLRYAAEVDQFEELQYRAQPWLYARAAS